MWAAGDHIHEEDETPAEALSRLLDLAAVPPLAMFFVNGTKSDSERTSHFKYKIMHSRSKIFVLHWGTWPADVILSIAPEVGTSLAKELELSIITYKMAATKGRPFKCLMCKCSIELEESYRGCKKGPKRINESCLVISDQNSADSFVSESFVCEKCNKSSVSGAHDTHMAEKVRSDEDDSDSSEDAELNSSVETIISDDTNEQYQRTTEDDKSPVIPKEVCTKSPSLRPLPLPRRRLAPPRKSVPRQSFQISWLL